MEKARFLNKWIIAVRPFSLAASAVPVLFGTAAAVSLGAASFHLVNSLLALIAFVALQGAANIVNDVYDYWRGIDKEVLPVSGAVVRKLLTPFEALIGAATLIILGCGIGFYLAFKTSMLLLPLGVVGVLIGIFYSVAPVGLKYRALGDLCVFLEFGIFGSLGAWIVQTGDFSVLPMVWSLPQSFLVVAILHANNWRDICGDEAGGFSTIASKIGDSASAAYYRLLLTFPFFLVVAFMLVPRWAGFGYPMPYSFVLVFFSLPLVLRLLKKADERKSSLSPLDFATLDGATGQLNLVFGVLSVAALVFSKIIG